MDYKILVNDIFLSVLLIIYNSDFLDEDKKEYKEGQMITYKNCNNCSEETGKVIKEPGDFYVAESRPKPDYNFPGKVEYDYDVFSLNDAYSDVEKLEKLATGKIKNAKQLEED